ncbi:hypothetical protein [uncultured Cohaesibacter sp.]|uniref:hypothetical protein n=1 Tax=uncultured Cohaesibacter sp. TaxID=1002546 RepID=UPI0037487988
MTTHDRCRSFITTCFYAQNDHCAGDLVASMVCAISLVASWFKPSMIANMAEVLEQSCKIGIPFLVRFGGNIG